MGGSGSDGLGAGLSAPVVPPAGEAGVFGQEVVGPGREDASLIRHRAREILVRFPSFMNKQRTQLVTHPLALLSGKTSKKRDGR